MRSKAGFWAGLIAALLFLFLPWPDGLSPQARRAAAVAVLMAVWWMTEAVDITATSLLPLVLYPALSVMDMDTTARRYADPTIFLFMGGFMIALAMQRWSLERRVALHVLAWTGGGPRRLLFGFMAATAVISMWVSNTATAIMMLPIALAVLSQIPQGSDGSAARYHTSLVLGLAYAGSIGGMATLIGTPPNMIFAGQAKALLPELGEVSFLKWFLLGFPTAVGLLALAWAYLSLRCGGSAIRMDASMIRAERDKLGGWSAPEKRVFMVSLLAAFGWIFKKDIQLGSLHIPGWAGLCGLPEIHDGMIGVAAGILLFLIPAGRGTGEKLLDWKDTARLPWNVIFLFGGGFALAESFRVTGLDRYLGEGLGFLKDLPVPVMTLILCSAVTFLSEIVSNTAMSTTMMPILAAAAQGMGIHPYQLMVPATLANSCGFMLPTATPPNAVAFGSGRVTLPQMARSGFWMNLIGIFWITAMSCLLLPGVFGIGP